MSGLVGDNLARASGVIASAGGGDFVKIVSAEVTGSAVASIDIEGCFTSTYDMYQIHFDRCNSSGSNYLLPIALDDSNAAITGTMYTKDGRLEKDYNDAGWTYDSQNSTSGFAIAATQTSYRDYLTTSGIIYINDPRVTRTGPGFSGNTIGYKVYGGSATDFWMTNGIGSTGDSTPWGGFKFQFNSNNIEVGCKVTVYGLVT